jgi:hypothetical protein
MKKAIIIASIAAWGLAALLITYFLITGLRGDSKVFNINVNAGGDISLIHEESFSLEGMDTFYINTNYQSVRVELNNGDKLTVRHYDYSNADPFTAEPGGGALDIRAGRRTAMGGFFGFGVSVDPRLEISVPRSFAGNVSLTSASGSVRIEDSVTWGDVTLKTTSGSIRVNGTLTSSETDVQSVSGSVRLNGKVRCSGLNVRTTSGSVTVSNCETGGQVFLKSTSGSVRSGNITGADVTCETTSGSQTLGAVEASGTVRLTSVSGSVRADAVRASQHHIHTTSGSIRIGVIDRNKGEIRSTSGSIRTN